MTNIANASRQIQWHNVRISEQIFIYMYICIDTLVQSFWSCSNLIQSLLIYAFRPKWSTILSFVLLLNILPSGYLLLCDFFKSIVTNYAYRYLVSRLDLWKGSPVSTLFTKIASLPPTPLGRIPTHRQYTLWLTEDKIQEYILNAKSDFPIRAYEIPRSSFTH